MVLGLDCFGFEPNEWREDAMMFGRREGLLAVLFGATDATAFALGDAVIERSLGPVDFVAEDFA
jgi:hypothetical protein